MSWKEYEASCIQRKLAGEYVPSFDSIVLSSMSSFPHGVKREELCSQVASRTGVFMLDVTPRVQTALKRLRDKGLVQSLGVAIGIKLKPRNFGITV